MNITDVINALIAGIAVTVPFGYFLKITISSKDVMVYDTSMINKLEKELPAYLDSICSSISAGNSLQQAIETTSSQNRTKLDEFFNRILYKTRSGMTLDRSLELEASFLSGCYLSLSLLSMSFSYRSGANMIESLTLLAKLCRDREHLKKKIKARTAQSRTQGYVLILVPLIFMLVLFLVSPQNMIPVFKSDIGRILLTFSALLQGLGALTIRAMLKQDIL
jgi:tight adherence protein B